MYPTSLLEYSNTVTLYGTIVQTSAKKQLEAVHTEAARIIIGATKLCCIDKLLAELGWETLQERCTKHKLFTLL